VAWRVITGRRVAVVPVAVAVGWELNMGDRVVVVREVRPTTVIVVPAAGGAPEEIEMQKEDTPENSADEQGSVVPEGDSAPAKEGEEEVEEEVDG
jgi:bifunctional DNA-binding transcriptional regulator/antitoxin component of YhaV-PrlF toxin-antitoxin module